MIKVPWPSFKSYIDAKLDYPQFVENDEYVFLAFTESGFHIESSINKNTEADYLNDFDLNYRANSNRPVTSKPSAFPEAVGFRARFQGMSATCAYDAVTNIDLEITEEKHIIGGVVFSQNAGFGDKAEFQVIDKNGIYAPANTVLESFVTDWYIPPHDGSVQPLTITTPFRAKLLSGLFVRIKYTAVNAPALDRKVGVNLFTFIRT